MNNKAIKWNIRHARKTLNLTQSELAFRMGISRQSYINIESGNTAIINPNISKMSEATGLPEEMILFGMSRKELSEEQITERNALQEQIETLKNDHKAEIDGLMAKVNLLEERHKQDKMLIETLTSFNETLREQNGLPEEVDELNYEEIVAAIKASEEEDSVNEDSEGTDSANEGDDSGSEDAGSANEG